MRILAVDDELLALEMLVDSIRQVMPHAEICPFIKYSEALAFVKKTHCDIAFLDIEIRGKNGISLAKELKDINPQMNIVFVTGYAEYALDAFSVAASGYVLKPVTAAAVQAELEHLRYAVDLQPGRTIHVQCFGNFEVFCDGKVLTFARTKTKELFAYLVNRRGAWCNVREIAAALWEDKKNTDTLQGHLRILVSDLVQTLQSVGEEDVLLKQRGRLAVSTNRIDCDFYRFLQGDVSAINSYTGEFMSQYSWAEFVIAYLDHTIQ